MTLLGKGKVTKQAAGNGEIRESKEAAWDEEIWQKGRVLKSYY